MEGAGGAVTRTDELVMAHARRSRHLVHSPVPPPAFVMAEQARHDEQCAWECLDTTWLGVAFVQDAVRCVADANTSWLLAVMGLLVWTGKP